MVFNSIRIPIPHRNIMRTNKLISVNSKLEFRKDLAEGQ